MEHIISVGKIYRKIACIKYSLGMPTCKNCHHKVIKHIVGRFVQLSIIYNTNPQNQM